MMEFMHHGGYSMWVVLLFGGIALTAAVIFAFRSEEERLGFIRGMSTATVFATLSGLAANLAATLHTVTTHEEYHQYPDIALVPMVGFYESLATPILGFTILAIVWFVTAIGLRRMAAAP